MNVEVERYRAAMALVAGQVYVIATDGQAGRSGFTATAVASVSISPPTILVCMNATGQSADILRANGCFSVNALSGGDSALADQFAGRTGKVSVARFDIGSWSTHATGAPTYHGALVVFDCRLVKVVEVATHLVCFGEVADTVSAPDRSALIYRQRDYRVA